MPLIVLYNITKIYTAIDIFLDGKVGIDRNPASILHLSFKLSFFWLYSCGRCKSCCGGTVVLLNRVSLFFGSFGKTCRNCYRSKIFSF